MKLLTETYKKEIALSLSCFDRLIITGVLPEISYGAGMTNYLFEKEIKIFDYPKFAEPFKESIRANAERISKEQCIEIEFIHKSGSTLGFSIMLQVLSCR